jgi:lantibiotic modifying enzyme
MKDALKRAGAITLQGIAREGWCCGLPLGVQVPGLMAGLSGISLGRLRVAETDVVPSVLLHSPAGSP